MKHTVQTNSIKRIETSRGFTLLEVLVAVTIFATALAALLSMVGAGISQDAQRPGQEAKGSKGTPRQQVMAHNLQAGSPTKRQRTDWGPLDCPLFRLYAEEPHVFTGIDYFE